jgi:hypothetical protein
MSAMSGTFVRTLILSERSAAQRIGNAAFLEPLTVISPLSGLPPLTTNCGPEDSICADYGVHYSAFLALRKGV